MMPLEPIFSSNTPSLSLSLSLCAPDALLHISESLEVSSFQNIFETLKVSTSFAAEALRQGSGRQKAPTANRAGWCINTLQSTVRQNKC